MATGAGDHPLRHEHEEPDTLIEPAELTSTERALLAAQAADDKQAADIVVLDVGEVLSIVDWFVITSASSRPGVQSIAEEVEARIKVASGTGPLRVEGQSDARWVLLDYGDIVVHVFLDEVRAYYELERLWGDVARLDWRGEGAAPGARVVND